MNMNILLKIRKELSLNVDKEYKEDSFTFFKEKVKIYGVRTDIVRAIAKKYFKEIADQPTKQIFSQCEELLKSDYTEEAIIAFSWAMNCKDKFEKEDFAIFESWLKNYTNNWVKCDDFCTHPFSALIEKYPDLTSNVFKWAKSENLWMRRASAVILIRLLKPKKMLKQALEIANILLLDKEDLVQKGYGWMLKEASKSYQSEIFDYIIKHKEIMPRTALRYAIEKMPDDMKRKVMGR